MAIRRDTEQMRILVLGASGPSGRLVVEQALGHGHEVVAFVRDPARLPVVHDDLTIVAGDVARPGDIAAVVGGCDAVISALGSRGERPVNVYSDGIANTIRAMSAQGVRRLVVTSSAGVGAAPGGISVAMRVMLALPGMKPVIEDMERMEADVMLSDLDWTIVRPAALTDGPLTGEYRVVPGTVVPGGKRVSRADVAALLLKCAESDRYLKQAVAVAY